MSAGLICPKCSHPIEIERTLDQLARPDVVDIIRRAKELRRAMTNLPDRFELEFPGFKLTWDGDGTDGSRAGGAGGKEGT